MPSSQQMIGSRIQLESVQNQKFIQTQPQHSLNSLSKNFQRLQGQHCRQPLSSSNREARGCARRGGTVPSLGPSPPAAPLLCYCFDWGRGMTVKGWGGSCAVRPCLFWLTVLESRSRLDLIFSLPPLPLLRWWLLPKTSRFLDPGCLFCFSPSRPMCHTHSEDTPPHSHVSPLSLHQMPGVYQG